MMIANARQGTPASVDSENGQPVKRGSRSRLSITLTALVAVASGAGLTLGALVAVSSASKVVEHRPQDNAVLPHVLVGLVVLGFIVGGTIATRSIRWVWWPISASVGERYGRTFRSASTSVSRLLRLVGASIALGFIVLLLFRMGFQATAVMEPSFRVNAWGGPSALGAFAAHGADALVCLALACCVLHKVLLPASPELRGDD